MTTPSPPLPADVAPRTNLHEDGDLSDMLSELCISLPGAQMLTAFLIILPFNSGAREFLQGERLIFLGTFFWALISLVLLGAPAVQHRLMRPLISRERSKRVATRQIFAGSFALALAFTLGTNMVISALMGQLLGLIASGTMAILIFSLWCVLPMVLKRRHGI